MLWCCGMRGFAGETMIIIIDGSRKCRRRSLNTMVEIISQFFTPDSLRWLEKEKDVLRRMGVNGMGNVNRKN